MITINKKEFTKGILASLALASFGYGMSASAASYTVSSGDTLSKIAQDHNTTVDHLAQLNKLPDPNLIKVGQNLKLPDSSDTKASPQAVPATPAPSSYLSDADLAAKEIIAFKESSGSYTAQNGQYYGRYQLSLSYLNGDLSPANQERVADAYVANRYGSWSAALNFWYQNGWY